MLGEIVGWAFMISVVLIGLACAKEPKAFDGVSERDFSPRRDDDDGGDYRCPTTPWPNPYDPNARSTYTPVADPRNETSDRMWTPTYEALIAYSDARQRGEKPHPNFIKEYVTAQQNGSTVSPKVVPGVRINEEVPVTPEFKKLMRNISITTTRLKLEEE